MSSDHAGPVCGFLRTAQAFFAVNVHDFDVMRRRILADGLQLAGEAVAFHMPLTGDSEVRMFLLSIPIMEKEYYY